MADAIQSVKVGHPTDLGQTVRMDTLRVLVLGLNAWVVLLLLPLVLAGPSGLSSLVWVTLPIPVLLAGAAVIPSQRLLAAWLLVALFPLTCAFLVAFMPQLAAHPPYESWGLVLGTISLVAFGGGAALATGRPVSVRETSVRPLGNVSPVTERAVRRYGRWVLVGVTGFGAFLLAVIAPMVGESHAYVEAWGEASREAATLTAVVGGALGTATLALIVGPGLRANRARPPSLKRSRQRALVMLGLFGVGLVLYGFYISAR